MRRIDSAMRRGTAILGRPLLLLLLLSGAFLLGAASRAAAPRSRSDGPPNSGSNRSTIPAAPAAEEAASVEIGAGVREPSPPTDLGALIAELTDLLATLPPAEGTDGSAAIEGRIRDFDGQPMPGILVRASPLGPPPGHACTTENIQARDLTKYVVDRNAEHRLRHDGARQALSDASGRFRIEGLAPAPYGIGLPLVGGEAKVSIQVRGSARGSAYPGDEVDIGVHVSCPVTVEVRTAAGVPLTPTRVRVDGEEHSFGEDSRVIRVLAGWRTFSEPSVADHHGSTEAYIHPDRILPVVLVLEPRTLSGISLSVGAFAGDELLVSWIALAPGELPGEERLLRNGSYASFSVEAEEKFQTEIALPPGHYAVGISRNHGSIEAIGTAMVGEASTSLAMTLPDSPPQLEFDLKVVGPDGKPIDSFDTHLLIAMRPGTLSIDHDRAESPDGITRISVASQESVEWGSGDLWIQVNCDLGILRVPVTSPLVQMEFQPAASLCVELTGWEGTGRNTEVRLVGSGPTHNWPDTVSDEEVIFVGVQPGDYSLTCGYQGAPLVEPIRIRLASGAHQVSIALPALCDIEVRLPAGLFDAQLRLFSLVARSQNSWRAEFTGARRGSTVRFAGLIPGDYSLVAYHGSGTLAMSLTVERDAAIEYRGASRQGLLIRVSGEPSEDAKGLRDGDIVTGFEGKEFESPAEISLLLQLVGESGRWSLLVERPGAGRVEIEVEGGRFQNWPGGGLALLRVSRE